MTPFDIRQETRRRLNGTIALLCPANVEGEHDVESLRRVRDRLRAEANWLTSVLPVLERAEARRAGLETAAAGCSSR